MFVADRGGLRIGLVVGGMTACLALLAACSGGGGSGPRTLPPLSTTPAAETSTAPVTSKAADLAAVTAVVRRYYQMLNAPTTVANADALAALMTRDCSCNKAARAIRSTAMAHRHYFGHSVIVSLRASIDSQTEADVYVQYNYSRSGFADASGNVLHGEQGRTGVKIDFRLAHVHNAWFITRVDLIASGSP